MMLCCWKNRSNSKDHQQTQTSKPTSPIGNNPQKVDPADSVPANSVPAHSVPANSVPAQSVPTNSIPPDPENMKTGNGRRERSNSETSFYSVRSSRSSQSSRSGDDYYSVCSGYGGEDAKNA